MNKLLAVLSSALILSACGGGGGGSSSGGSTAASDYNLSYIQVDADNSETTLHIGKNETELGNAITIDDLLAFIPKTFINYKVGEGGRLLAEPANVVFYKKPGEDGLYQFTEEGESLLKACKPLQLLKSGENGLSVPWVFIQCPSGKIHVQGFFTQSSFLDRKDFTTVDGTTFDDLSVLAPTWGTDNQISGFIAAAKVQGDADYVLYRFIASDNRFIEVKDDTSSLISAQTPSHFQFIGMQNMMDQFGTFNVDKGYWLEADNGIHGKTWYRVELKGKGTKFDIKKVDKDGAGNTIDLSTAEDGVFHVNDGALYYVKNDGGRAIYQLDLINRQFVETKLIDNITNLGVKVNILGFTSKSAVIWSERLLDDYLRLNSTRPARPSWATTKLWEHDISTDSGVIQALYVDDEHVYFSLTTDDGTDDGVKSYRLKKGETAVEEYGDGVFFRAQFAGINSISGLDDKRIYYAHIQDGYLSLKSWKMQDSASNFVELGTDATQYAIACRDKYLEMNLQYSPTNQTLLSVACWLADNKLSGGVYLFDANQANSLQVLQGVYSKPQADKLRFSVLPMKSL